jgi:formylglycine-generating enzyme required for sulfatase activity
MEIQACIREELRKKSVCIPEGSFMMGSFHSSDETPIHEVFLHGFFIDAFPVTNRQYVQFLNERGIANKRDGSYEYFNPYNKQTRIRMEGELYVVDEGYEQHPLTGVNWHGAYAFTLWVNGRLPTEAEWEKAARGSLEGKMYPWGDEEPTPTMANFGEYVGDTTPVGSYPPNRAGLFDVAGNVSEWCLDWYHRNYYGHAPRENPKGPSTGSERVIRGGNWSYGESALRVAKRGKTWHRIGKTNLGFRIVFDR